MNQRPDWWLERVALGEEAGDDLTDAEKTRIDELLASNASILAALPPAGVKREVERRLNVQRRPRRAWVIAAIPAVAVAATILLLPDSPTERTKGEARLVVHKKVQDGAEQLDEGDVLNSGALLQVGYTPGATGYGAVLSIDGRRAVTMHWPKSDAKWSPAVDPRGAALPSAYELDDAPDFERFFLVNCPERFSVSELLRDADRLAADDARNGALAVEPPCRVDSIRFEKATP